LGKNGSGWNDDAGDSDDNVEGGVDVMMLVMMMMMMMIVMVELTISMSVMVLVNELLF